MASKSKLRPPVATKTGSDERTIYFYRVYPDDPNDDGTSDIDFRPALRHIGSLAFDSSGRYWSDASGAVICGWPDLGNSHPCVQLGSIRRSNLPLLETKGKLSGLPIAPEAGLVEITHLRFFPKRIVGCVYNHHGPRASRLPLYLEARAKGRIKLFQLALLARRDVIGRLKKLEEIKLFRLRVQKSFIDAVAEADADLGAAMKRLEAVSNAGEIEVVLKPASYSRESLGQGILRHIKQLAGLDGLEEGATAFKVKGRNPESGGEEIIDVLSDKLLSKKKILKQNERARSLDPTSAFSAIEEAYKELRDELERAPDLL